MNCVQSPAACQVDPLVELVRLDEQRRRSTRAAQVVGDAAAGDSAADDDDLRLRGIVLTWDTGAERS